MKLYERKPSLRAVTPRPLWVAFAAVAAAGCAGADDPEATPTATAFSGAIPSVAGEGPGQRLGAGTDGQSANSPNGSEVSSPTGGGNGANLEGVAEGGAQATTQTVESSGQAESTEGQGAANLGTGDGEPSSEGAGGGAMGAGEVPMGAGGAGMGPVPPEEPVSEDETAPPAPGGDEGQPDSQDPPSVNPLCAGQFFCDGFEGVSPGGSANPDIWDTMTNYSVTAATNNVQVSSANAHTGNQAMRVLGNAGRSGIIAELPTNDPYFIRAWFQIDSAPLGPVFIGLGTDGNSEIRLRLSNQNWGTINTVGPGDAIRPGGATSGNCPECLTLPTNQWFCAEFFVDEGAQNATLWIDEVQAAEIVNGQGGWPSQPNNPSLFLGSMTVQGGQADVWLDDVVAGPVRIGCD